MIEKSRFCIAGIYGNRVNEILFESTISSLADRIIQWVMFFLAFFCFSCLHAHGFHPKDANHFLLTTPHSGTNLTYSYLQALAHKPVYRLNSDLTLYETNPLETFIDVSKKALFKSHHGELLSLFNQTGSKLLFILRDYKEVMVRNSLNNKKLNDLFHDEPKFDLYIDNLRVYDQWDSSNRLLIFYEDLITCPAEEMAKIILFFDEPIPDCFTPAFLKEINEAVLSYYDKRYQQSGGSHSKGSNLKYHTKDIQPAILKTIDEHIATQYPALWSKYLSRYKEH